MKNLIMKILLHFLYRGIKVLNGRDSEITKEISRLPNGYTISILTDLHKSIELCFKIVDNKIKKCKKGTKSDLQIVFKNKDLSFKTFTGKIGISNSYAMHYFQMFGNIYIAMGVTRILERVEGYLFPKCITNKCLKSPVQREISMFKTYILCIL